MEIEEVNLENAWRNWHILTIRGYHTPTCFLNRVIKIFA